MHWSRKDISRAQENKSRDDEDDGVATVKSGGA
jgi:hypothetical protein